MQYAGYLTYCDSPVVIVNYASFEKYEYLL